MFSVFFSRIPKQLHFQVFLKETIVNFKMYKEKLNIVKSNRVSTCEYLSQDILEEDFMKSFAPLHFMQKLLCTCRVNAKYRFVTEPTRYQRIFSCLCIILTSIWEYFYSKIYLIRINFKDSNISLFLTTCGILQYVVYVFNIILTRYTNSKKNVKIYIKIQYIDRLMKIHQIDTLYKILYNRNLFVVFLNIAMATLMITIALLTLNFETAISRVVVFISTTSFHLEMYLFYNLMNLVTIRLKLFNEILMLHSSNLKSKIRPLDIKNNYLFANDNLLRKLAWNTTKFNLGSTNTIQILEEILDTFSIIKMLFKNQV